MAHNHKVAGAIPAPATIFLICVLGVLAGSLPARAAITGTNAFDLQSVASTTNTGNGFAVTGVIIPTRTLLIQHLGIAGQTNATGPGTNSLQVEDQFSFDGSNFVTLATYKPSRTNATVDAFTPVLDNVTIYRRMRVITTNTITVGVTATKP